MKASAIPFNSILNNKIIDENILFLLDNVNLTLINNNFDIKINYNDGTYYNG